MRIGPVSPAHDLYKYVRSQNFDLFHADSTDLGVEPDNSLLSWATAVLLQPKQVAVDIPDIEKSRKTKVAKNAINYVLFLITHAGSTIK